MEPPNVGIFLKIPSFVHMIFLLVFFITICSYLLIIREIYFELKIPTRRDFITNTTFEIIW